LQAAIPQKKSSPDDRAKYSREKDCKRQLAAAKQLSINEMSFRQLRPIIVELLRHSLDDKRNTEVDPKNWTVR
jgi:hypothetical protein